MASSRRASALNVWLALGIVYIVWGSTYLAIAIAVQTLPPLLYAGLRFALAGVLLSGWLAFRGVDLRISRRELAGAATVGILLLAIANGLVVFAERTVPSGVAALIVASIPLCIVIYRMLARERCAGRAERDHRSHRRADAVRGDDVVGVRNLLIAPP
jgi:drug/metabolite transporter (DMT)-like permease